MVNSCKLSNARMCLHLQDVLHEKLGKARDTLNRKREKYENEHNQWIAEVIEMIYFENRFYQCSLKLVYVFKRRTEKDAIVLYCFISQ